MRRQAPDQTRLQDLLGQCASALSAAGFAEPRDEARWLLSAALGLSAAELISRSLENVTPAQRAAVEGFMARRLRREPLSRILGVREFYGRSFEVTPATLDPRPETETLVDAVLALLDRRDRDRPLRILDVGTGTGCILSTLLCELPNAQGVGTDISGEAIQVARRNADRLGLAPRACWLIADLAEGVQGEFDLVVSNPPYIRSGDIEGLDAAVRNFDPLLALAGGEDGLEFYRRLAGALPGLMRQGLVVVETGYDQAGAVADILQKAGIWDLPAAIDIFNDVAGIPRVVAARARTGGYA